MQVTRFITCLFHDDWQLRYWQNDYVYMWFETPMSYLRKDIPCRAADMTWNHEPLPLRSWFPIWFAFAFALSLPHNVHEAQCFVVVFCFLDEKIFFHLKCNHICLCIYFYIAFFVIYCYLLHILKFIYGHFCLRMV